MIQSLSDRLRAMYEARVHHFTPHGHGGAPQPQAFAIVATEERLRDLLEAAELLDGPMLTHAKAVDLAAELDRLKAQATSN